mgnify:CR=1 FL=1|tara:strand:+ start:74 stop:499 length:426 start_codon:yes stop_codon:yes gene_type:complete
MSLNLKSDPAVSEVFEKYPANIKPRMKALRCLVLEVAEELSLYHLEETLKWGEPSYLAKKGSTIRMDWKAKNPNQYAMYFKCTSKLVPTFKELFWDDFRFEGTRAIVFQLQDQVSEKALKKCIAAALTYHQVKKLPDLGIK